MKKNIVLAALFSLFVLAVSASAQTTDFSGAWTLDVAQSKLGDRSNIATQTLTVAQTAKDISITTATTRTPPPADATQGGRGGGGRMGAADGTTVYNLDGKETTSEVEGPMGKMPVKMTAKIEGGKLNLSSSRTFTGQMGEITMTSKDTWELAADGKKLTVNRESTSPRGTNTTTLVYVKK